jgi:indolepyruvate ferredoxin oxidoreductase beta subunit
LVERFTRKGRVVQTTALTGFLQLYLLAGLRRWRRKSLRFQREQVRIDEWLAAVLDLTRDDYARAMEAATLPGLLKGYGDTYARGQSEFDAAMSVLATSPRQTDLLPALPRDVQ